MQCVSFLTGNKPPGVVPNKFMYMTKDMERLADYFNVPLAAPSDPFEVMFKKGTYKEGLTGSVVLYRFDRGWINPVSCRTTKIIFNSIAR